MVDDRPSALDTYNTEVTPSTSSNGVARPQEASGEHSELVAPATAEVESEPSQVSASVDQAEVVVHESADEVTTQEEVAPLKAASAPTKPSAADVAEHNITHTPCRSWWGSCVEGRGLGEQRGRHAGRPPDIPRVGIDYWYITAGSIKLRKEFFG